jgi:uncharacterized membrane protein
MISVVKLLPCRGIAGSLKIALWPGVKFFRIGTPMAETTGKREAQQRVYRIRAFRRELAQLAHEGVLALSGEQCTKLDAYHDATLADLAARFDVDISESQRQMSLAMRIASALGGLAFCTAVFLFFYRYWGLFSTAVQVVILVLVPILGVIAAEAVSRKERTLYYTSLIVLVALAAFIMNLAMLGLIFNIAPTPVAFLAWGVLALVLAYRFGLRLPLAGALTALVIYSASIVVTLAGGSWDASLERPETYLPGGLALLAVPVVWQHRNLAGFRPIYRIFGLLFAGTSILILAIAGQLTFLPLAKRTAEELYQTIGLVAAGVAIWTGVRNRLPECVNLGSAFFAIYLFVRLYQWWWDWMPRYLFFLIIGFISLLLLAVFRRLRGRTGTVEAA